MIKDENILNWISNWYSKNCDGDWEHDSGVSIETLDNPGWSVSIDLIGTNVDIPDITWMFVENSEDDWYGYKIEGGKFEASGDPSKLELLLCKFKEMVNGSCISN